MSRGRGNRSALPAATQVALAAGRTNRSRPWTSEDHAEALRVSLEKGVTPGAIRPPHYTLEELATVIGRDAGSLVMVSDVHGQPELLAESLERLGLLREGSRVGAGVTLGSIGDLVDGRSFDGDQACLEMADLFDVYLPGNHEAAIMGGGTFDGLPAPHMIPDLGRGLDRLAWQGKMPAALSFAGILISHAGVHREVLEHSSPDDAVRAADELWTGFLGSRQNIPDELFALDGLRGGSSSRGGLLWQDWRSLLENAPLSYRQMVGHSPRGSCETDPSGRLTLIDTAGGRIGIAVISPKGEIRVGSSWVPRGEPSDELDRLGACPIPEDLAQSDT